MGLKEELQEMQENSFDNWFDNWFDEEKIKAEMIESANDGYGYIDIECDEKDDTEIIRKRKNDVRLLDKLKEKYPEFVVDKLTYETTNGLGQTFDYIRIAWN